MYLREFSDADEQTTFRTCFGFYISVDLNPPLELWTYDRSPTENEAINALGAGRGRGTSQY